jgi:hypothetical protein
MRKKHQSDRIVAERTQGFCWQFAAATGAKAAKRVLLLDAVLVGARSDARGCAVLGERKAHRLARVAWIAATYGVLAGEIGHTLLETNLCLPLIDALKRRRAAIGEEAITLGTNLFGFAARHHNECKSRSRN